MWKWIPISLLILAGTSLSSAQDRDRRDTRGSGESQKNRVLKVFDAKGRLVGPLSHPGDGEGEGVVLDVGGTGTFAGITRSSDDMGQVHASKYVWSAAELYYPTSDCSGQPVIFDAPPVFRPSVVDRRGATATLYIAPDVPTTSMTLGSQSFKGSCRTPNPPPFVGNVWPIQTVYSLTEHYPEPLAVHY